jgi:hypothetical protein
MHTLGGVRDAFGGIAAAARSRRRRKGPEKPLATLRPGIERCQPARECPDVPAACERRRPDRCVARREPVAKLDKNG